MRFVKHLPRVAIAVGTAAAAYAGYGTGLAHAAGGTLSHWLQVAALAGGSLCLTGIGIWKAARSASAATPSLAAELAVLERLIPTVRRHPDGMSAFQELVDVVLEACYRPDLLERRTPHEAGSSKGGGHA